MIARELEDSRKIARDPEIGTDFGPQGPVVAALCSKLLETLVDPDFPGALVPSVNAQGTLCVLIGAPTLTTWRRLTPVLRAFAGPTLTSFDGLARALPLGDSSADAIARSQPAATGVIDLPLDDRTRFAALRALSRARDTFARAPNLQRSAPEPTSWLLARFQDCLNVGRNDAATEILATLKNQLRLDSLNLMFLEVQLLAAFGDWQGIVELPGFSHLCVARRTPVVTGLLLEALFHVHLAPSFVAGSADEIRSRFEADVRLHAKPMLTVPASATLTAPGWRIYGLEAWVDTSRVDILAAVAGRQEALGWIGDRLGSAAVRVEANPCITLSPLDDARSALARIDALESVDSISAALAALEKLTPEELARLREAGPFRAALSVTEEARRDGLPNSWIDWLSRSADPSFTSALLIARRGKDEWPIGVETGDPIAVQSLVQGLERAFGDDISAERATVALPFLVAWLRRDPEFPNSSMVPVYSSLLTLFALSAARGRVTYESSLVLINGLLTSGVDSKGYRALIADIEELAGDGFGVSMIYWMLEIVEEFMWASTPDADARQTFLHSALARLAPIFSRLSCFQRAATALLAHDLGWTLRSLGISEVAGKDDGFAYRIRGLRIAIYSLTESSSRQAKVAIEEVAPTAVVECNADHGGTARLKALAEGADIFVMTWLSAKHAATDFIREHRASRPLLYAQGRGVSSILRAIEDHFTIGSH